MTWQPPPRPGQPGAKSPLKPSEPTSSETLLQQTARLMAAVFAEPSQDTASLLVVFKALERPNSRIVIELPWYADGSKHQIVLKLRNGSRLVFYNPLGHGTKPPGTELTDGLKRRIEPDGTESCELSEIEMLFRAGKARALISPPLS